VQFSPFLPQFAGLRLCQLIVEDIAVTVVATPRRSAGICPACRRRSTRVHSLYERALVDLPWGNRPVRLRVTVRRFRCVNRACSRRIFVERLPDLAPMYARRTRAQRVALEDFGFAAGGAAGARLANRRGVVGSRATILRFVHASPLPTVETPRVLGVDDWSSRRGRTYGTILIDLERRRVVDLLEERTADVLARWLREHPGVEIIARDRGGAYADGVRQGAPDTVQVADRFHLIANAGDALERVLVRKHQALRAAASTIDRENAARDVARTETIVAATVGATKAVSKHEQETLDRRARRQARYDEVVRLFAQGMAIRAIGRQVRLSRKTVARYLRAGSFPEHAPRRPRPSILAPYEPYLRERWTAGCHNARVLWEEISARGFRGAASLVRGFVASWRTSPGRRGRSARGAISTGDTIPHRRLTRVRSPKQARWLLLRAIDSLSTDERVYREALLRECPELEIARALVEAFGRMVRERNLAALDPWLHLARASGLPELQEFAAGIGRDKAAVQAALSYSWSNGQTEGQVNRLKFLKRQMYGRASFALLKRRVLRAA
jgi:transposase